MPRSKSQVFQVPSALAVANTAPDANRFGECICILMRYVETRSLPDFDLYSVLKINGHNRLSSTACNRRYLFCVRHKFRHIK